IFVAVPATVGLILVGRPIIAVLFEHGRFTAADTGSTAWTLSFYAIGLCGFFGQQILTRAFYSTQNSKVPAITAVGAVLTNIVLNLILIWPLGTGGLALSTAICSYLQVVVLMAVLKKKHPVEMTKGLRKTILKTACATGVMAAAGFGVVKLLSNMPLSLKYDLFRVGVLVVVCAGVYTGVSVVLKSEMLVLLVGHRKQKTPHCEN
ncbi:MAG: lipid II flippase MurJ, partial [Planctomycetota bacterium]